MVTVLSIGIENGGEGLDKISCAYADATRIYAAFEKALGNNLKRSASVCVKDITTIECKALISALGLAMEDNDTVIFFFSGHGDKSANGKLQLFFSDYADEGKKGSIFLEEIVLSLKKLDCSIFMILDCCHSGAALAESVKDDYKNESNISIMTSTGPYGRDEICEEGSKFTNAVCKALGQIMDTKQQIAISDIFSCIKEEDPESQLVIGGGESELVLCTTERVQYPKDFAKVFTNKIEHINYEMREALWYSAGYLPTEIKIDLLKHYLQENQNGCKELSWRVRRAIGSVYGYGNNKKIDEYIKQLLSSDIWADKCVGYICANKSKEPDIVERMCNDLQNADYPMDLIWLLALYLSDIDDKQIESLILKSSLMQSAWGAMEVWKRYFKKLDKNSKLALFKSHVNGTVYKQLCRELYFKKEIDSCEYINREIKGYVEFVQKLYGCKIRGRSNVSRNSKWIFSILYGNWRDQVDINPVFERQWRKERDQEKLLKALRYIPSVEIKMAILDYLSRISKESQVDVDSMTWALKDQHPWVIRSALPLFRGKQELVVKHINKSINMQIYPGVFDLAIELSRQELDNGFEYPINKMNDYEKETLRIAIEREHNV